MAPGMVAGTLGPICFWTKASCLCLENLEAIRWALGWILPGPEEDAGFQVYQCLTGIEERDPERLLGLPERQWPQRTQCWGRDKFPEEAGWAVVRVVGLESRGRNRFCPPAGVARVRCRTLSAQFHRPRCWRPALTAPQRTPPAVLPVWCPLARGQEKQKLVEKWDMHPLSFGFVPWPLACRREPKQLAGHSPGPGWSSDH